MDYGHLETEYGQVNLLIFKSLRKKVNLEIKEERREFICRIYPLINDWKSKYPDLGSIFRPEEVDWLLSDSIDIKYRGPNKSQGGQFIKFVTRSGYKDKPNVDENGKPLLQRTTALLHSAKLVISNNKELVRCLFKIYDRYDANYTDERGLTHFHIACRHDFDDIVKKFLEHGLDPNIPQTEEVTTPLNLTIDHKRKKCFKLLLRNGANNPNRANDEGMTPLHRLCEKDVNYDWMELFFEINDEIQQTVLVDARANNGDTPMHTALYDEEIEKFKFLLKRRADPNIANEEGLTPLHIICSRKIDDDLAKIFLKLNDGIHQTVQIDVQDKLGSTPLHWALNCGNKKVTEILLKKGADLNLAERDGWTPLHFFCTSSSYNNLMKILFEISDEKHQLVHLDAKNKKGDTPLYLALSSDNKKAVELLLRRGANPNLADADGSTSLHLICKRNNDDDLVDVFFKAIHVKHRPVHVDARNKLARTPLQSAVANLLPHVVDVLLDHGADLSNFSFPNESYFGERFKPKHDSLDYKLELASRVLTIVESLEIRGYELNRNEILTIMKFFANHKLTDNSGLDEFWHSNEGVLSKAKKILMNPSMSLYELIRSKNQL